MTRARPTAARQAKRARRAALRRPDHVRALVPIICMTCGRFQLNETRHRPAHKAVHPDGCLLEHRALAARFPDLAAGELCEAVLSTAWTCGVSIAGVNVPIGILTLCRCGSFEARYAEAA